MNTRAVASIRVLVVEDEDNIAYVVESALRVNGFEVTRAETGHAALAAVASQRPDLIILDVMLGDLDGFSLCRRLRHSGVDTPVLFLTARDDAADRVRGLTIGGDDYVTKPFSVEELVARVRNILRRVGAGAPEREILRCGPLEVDDDAHVVRRDGQEVSLSPTEYKLLRFLLRNQGRVLSRGQILDHVWDYSFDGESTVVETFVSSLRSKVDRGPDRLIHTVRGVGYRLGLRS
jgi:two-component system OmpR family response regulator